MIQALSSLILALSSLSVSLQNTLQVVSAQTAYAETVIATSSPENILSISEKIILSAKKYNTNQVISLKIASCESGQNQFNQDGTVLRGSKDHDDIGIYQINQHFNGADAKKLGFDITSVDGNINYGNYLLSTQGTTPWNASRNCWKTSDSK